ncbi:peptidase S10, serine carboxypeptidase [Polychaeton citri CBS 116435]|uniref:Carboxypeptidase n=1 Tax=Polychaeton citri CBS 116435 TaxID=1314669 RepID=A0A9P4Q381_9PEZI|nr:peptidase S10, serine carboxypeptidase [Polychaeton citri CBS 116435]
MRGVFTSLLCALPLASAGWRNKRQVPADPSGVTTISSPSGATIRYKQPGLEGVCETTPGVNSYSGYVSLNATTNMFFYFFEARENPEHAPLTLWLNGGPGSDSLIGLFQELGPCSITENLTSQLNPYSWTNQSNMLFLSQPIGVGFSYEDTLVGNYSANGTFYNQSLSDAAGRYSDVAPDRTDTTYLAAVGTWEILQGFLANLPTLDNTVQNKTFNLWTESYGGHYGPAFWEYFYEQNSKLSNGTTGGTALHMDTLGIINGIIDERIQAPYYPEFAVHNTYGIKAYNETIYNFTKMAYYIPGGCRDYIDYCAEVDLTTEYGTGICQAATEMCRSLVEGTYYEFGGRGVYDIRHPYDDPTPADYFVDYLNTAAVQNALGVNINYTATASDAVYYGFATTGDFVYRHFIEDLELILARGMRVALIYGDADYICNWFGGEAVSLAVDYADAANFRKAGYEPFVVDGTQYGEVRQYGNFSFLRMYESGHEVPYYQPKASLELFRRVLGNLIVSDGSAPVTGDYNTTGSANTTHTESFVPLPSSTGSSDALRKRAYAYMNMNL